MSDRVIERADELPLVIYWLVQMRVAQVIDAVWPYPHPNRQGLSYGQLALLFIAFVVYLRSHRLCEMEEWVEQHQGVLRHSTGWEIQVKDTTDDRLGDLLYVLGEDEDRSILLQRQLGQHLIQAYALLTHVGRYDTTSFTVHHAPDEEGQAARGLLRRGHSKDHRPDLLQFKQGLGTLDPAGVPLFTNTVGGQAADDPLYLPAWQEMCVTVGHRHFLFVADCKAAALQTRAEIDAPEGAYLFPLPMTGEVPDQLRRWVLQPPVVPEPLVLDASGAPGALPLVVGQGFRVERTLHATLADGQAHTWQEGWLVTCSETLAKRHQQKLLQRLAKAEAELQHLNAKTWPSAEALSQAAQPILARRAVGGLLTVQVQETVSQQTRYGGRGRPGPHRPPQIIEVHQFHLTWAREVTAINEALALAGWRIHVTNVPAQHMSLNQAIAYYRDEFLVERGFHRFKHGSLPVLPLYVRLPERIRGLMLLLLMALQVLTLMEFVTQRTLAQRKETLAGLVPGNPTMKSSHPTAERMLARFSNLHFVSEQIGVQIIGRFESLTLVQQRILFLLDVPAAIYTTPFEVAVDNFPNSS